MFIFFISGCKKEETPKPWKIKIEDGTELYNYSGVTYNPAISDGSSAAFSSEASQFFVDIRGKLVKAQVVKTPFVNKN